MNKGAILNNQTNRSTAQAYGVGENPLNGKGMLFKYIACYINKDEEIVLLLRK